MSVCPRLRTICCQTEHNDRENSLRNAQTQHHNSCVEGHSVGLPPDPLAL